MDSLITILIFVIIAIFSAWSQKKSRETEAETEDVWPEEEPETTAAPPPVQRGREQPRPQRTPPSPGRSHWEEELRRLLEGEAPRPRQPSPPPPPQPAPPPPPPVIISEGSGPFPPTIPTSRPAPPGPYTLPKPRPPVQVSRRFSSAASPAEYQRAARSFETVADHFRHIGEHKLPATRIQSRRRRSREVDDVVRMFRNPRAARKAVIASFILGPCKAVEERGI